MTLTDLNKEIRQKKLHDKQSPERHRNRFTVNPFSCWSDNMLAVPCQKSGCFRKLIIQGWSLRFKNFKNYDVNVGRVNTVVGAKFEHNNEISR